jgi:hypothetical protein
MIILNFGRWNNAGGFLFIRKRIYIKRKWTPFVRLSIRYKDKKQCWDNILWGLGLKAAK